MENGTGQFDHLKGDRPSEASGNVLSQVSAKAKEWQERKDRIKELEDELKDAKKKFNKVSQEEIPELLLQSGLSSVALDSGEKVTIKEDVSASVKDMPGFYRFLVERGDEAIVKTNLQFGKIPGEVLTKIQNHIAETFELFPDVNQGVHYQTLQKYIRELCGIGGGSDAEMSLAELDEEMVSVFTYYKTTVK